MPVDLTMKSFLFSLFLVWPLLVVSFQISPPTSVTATSRSASVVPLFLSSEAEQQSTNRLSIEYCAGCRWMLKSFWLAQELLTTFESDIDSVTLIPGRTTSGIFAIKYNGGDLLWDRKEQGGFPSPKGLKQIVRDLVAPEQFLGHSDTMERQEAAPDADAPAELARADMVVDLSIDASEAPHPAIVITYCTGCRWLLRAAYFGQELLTTFDEELNSVTLVPSAPPAKGGRFVSAFVSR
jgi:selenoprotein W-related protein